MRIRLRQVLARWQWLMLLVLTPHSVAWGEGVPLPEPFTLDAALALSQELHPQQLLAQAERDAATARERLAAARYGSEISFTARARAIDPSPVGERLNRSNNDSNAELLLRRRLYDFGQTRAQVAASEADSDGSAHHQREIRLQRQLDVMARYLEVKLADAAFQVQDEAMAIAFIRMDRIQDRSQLGQASDVEVLELQSRYQEVRRARYRAQADQRSRRARLAIALNRPGELSRDLETPRFPGNGRPVPDLVAIEREALSAGPSLLALRATVQAQRQRVAAAKAGGRPVLTGSLTASEYNRQFGGDDDLEAELALELPLSTGGRVAADTALARAELRQAEARLAQAELEVRQAVYDLLQDIAVLQAQRDEVAARADFRDLDLDRSRSLYELEVNSDLGDAMVRFSEVRLREAETEFNLGLAWEELAVLTDNPHWSARNPLQPTAE